MNFGVVTEQICMLSFVMLLGFVIVKTGYVGGNVKDGISKIIVKLILPCLIISSISSKELNSELLGDIAVIFALSLFCIFTLFCIGILTSKLFKIPDETKPVHKLLVSTGNVIFIGYPIIFSVYGEQGFLYAIMYWLINDLFLWTVGVFMLSGKEKTTKKDLWKKLLNPSTVSFFVAVIMLVFGIKLPPVIKPAMEEVGALTTYLSMIFIGMALAEVNVKKAVSKWWVFVIALIKLIVMPIIFILIFRGLGVKEIILGAVVLEAAMPAQTVLTILANEHKADFEYAAVGMFVTTIASIVTLPLICYLLDILV
ncbi:MAG: AEC family transporter [Ruminococcaceae bacterium]|nr:AEC family transporter [Oscillospiraceae bacterium]